jgi:hypothetical protein
VIHGRFWSVEVLRAVVVVTKAAGSEPDRGARHITDGPDETSAESVVHPSFATREESGGLEFDLGELFGRQVLAQRVERVGRVTNTEHLTRGAVETTTGDEITGELRLG